MTKIITPTIELKKKWIEFLDRNFGYAQDNILPTTYAIDFAPIVSEKNFENARLLLDENSIASSAALYPRKVIVQNKPVLHIGIIGAVATNEQHRGKGYSKQIIEEIEMLAVKQNLDGLLLWSDQKEFYEHLGFGEVGKQVIYSLYKMKRPALKKEGRIEYAWAWDRVSGLYNQHANRVERDLSYWNELQKITSCDRAQWVEPNGNVTAYIGFNRGKDMQGIVHEWGGENSALQALVYGVQQSLDLDGKDLFWLTSPVLSEDPVKVLLADPTKSVIEQSLGYFKPLKPTATLSILNQMWFWGLDSM